MKKLLICIIIISGLTRCASMDSLTGGEEDKDAAVIIHSNVKPRETNFSGDKLKITFNEYIDLQEPDNEIIISPEPSTKPEIKKIKKSIIIDFNNGLNPNTTYTVDFGNSIHDYTAGNITPLTLTFSTGNKIDTLSIKGIIKDAYSGAVLSDIKVGLYMNYKDTSLYSTIPLYSTRSDVRGRFIINGLPENNYKVIAFEDKNKDKKPEEGSLIGFSKDLINSNYNKDIKINLFKNLSDIRLILKSLNKIDTNLYKAIFNKNVIHYYDQKTDTLIFYSEDRIININAENKLFTVNTDTISFKSGFKRTIEPIKTSIEYFGIKDQQYYFSKYPLKQNQSYVIKQKDSLKTKIKSTEFKQIFYNNLLIGTEISNNITNYKSESYILIIDSSQKFEDGKPFTYYSDNIINASDKETGTLTIKVNRVNSYKGNYIIEVYTINNIYRQIISDSGDVKIFKNIFPGNYNIRIIKDENKNNIWDYGNIHKQKLPETIINPEKVINIKANWDVDTLIDDV